MSKLPFVSRIQFIRSKLSNCSAHVSGVTNSSAKRHSSGVFVSMARRLYRRHWRALLTTWRLFTSERTQRRCRRQQRVAGGTAHHHTTPLQNENECGHCSSAATVIFRPPPSLRADVSSRGTRRSKKKKKKKKKKRKNVGLASLENSNAFTSNLVHARTHHPQLALHQGPADTETFRLNGWIRVTRKALVRRPHIENSLLC